MDKVLRVGIAGLGTVGASVARLLHTQARDLAARTGRAIKVAGVSARDPHRDRGIDLSGVAFFADPVALAQSDTIDLFVELIGGDEGAARKGVTAALSAGKSVVTANKALLAKHGLELAALAEKTHAALAFEASVAGGIPIVKTLREGLAGNSIARVYGILNGTCNYILSRMELEGLTFAECLADAQKLGYAEADPTFDIGGFDTAHKLAILAVAGLWRETRCGQYFHRGHSGHFARRSQGGGRTRFPRQTFGRGAAHRSMASSSACTRPWCRCPRPSPR